MVLWFLAAPQMCAPCEDSSGLEAAARACSAKSAFDSAHCSTVIALTGRLVRICL